MKIVVIETRAGWIVRDGVEMGPFSSRQRAVDLAEGMVQTLREHGEDAELVFAETPIVGAVAERGGGPDAKS